MLLPLKAMPSLSPLRPPSQLSRPLGGPSQLGDEAEKKLQSSFGLPMLFTGGGFTSGRVTITYVVCVFGCVLRSKGGHVVSSELPSPSQNITFRGVLISELAFGATRCFRVDVT